MKVEHLKGMELSSTCASGNTQSLSITSEELSSLDRGIRLWAQELQVALCSESVYETVCFSPFSILSLIGLFALGLPEGDALEKVKEKLGVADIPTESFHQGLQSITSAMRSEDENLELTMANAIAYEDSIIHPDYLHRATSYYKPENFLIQEGGLEEVNQWVSDCTKGKINDLVNTLEGPATLLNALYFKGEWEYEFNPRHTRERTFTCQNGEEQEVYMMAQLNVYHKYFQQDACEAECTPGFQLLEMPFKGRNVEDQGLSMVVVLPNEGGDLSEVEARFASSDLLQNCRDVARSQKLSSLTLPKLDLEYCCDSLMSKLEKLGIPMDEEMSRAGLGVHVAKVFHKTKLKVDEKGAEGLSVTGAGLFATSVEQKICVNVNRPFALYIMAGNRPIFQASIRDSSALETV